MRVQDHIDVESLRNAAWRLAGTNEDFDPLIQRIGNASFVLLGEASHGTHEFYSTRAEITKRLIEEKDFTALAVEADWPDAYRVNRFVRGDSQDKDPAEALSSFKRFPTWMWRNADVRDFAGWLRQRNDKLSAGKTKAGFYGLDLYSLYESIEAVLKYLQKVDPEGLKRAQYRYSCFDHFAEDVQRYGYATHLGLSKSCEHDVIEQLIELRRKATEYAQRDGRAASDEFFFAEQNARLVKNAERYYRAMFQGRVSSWNLRDQHMAETLDSLLIHLKRRDGHARIVVWRTTRISVMRARRRWHGAAN